MFSFTFSPRKFKRAKKAKKTANADQPDAVPDQANLAPDPRDEIIRKLEAELKKKQGEVKKQKLIYKEKTEKLRDWNTRPKIQARPFFRRKWYSF